MNLENKVVVITGGSEGFGKSLARMFSHEKSRLIIAGHEQAKLEDAAKELGADYLLIDVTRPQELNNLAAYVSEKYGTIDIWINNAGIQIAPSMVENVDIEKLHHLFEVNFFGYFYGCQSAIRCMKKQSHGLIVNVNSTAGLDGKSGLSAYSSSKFATKGLTESLRKEVVDTHIQVFAVYPGGMQTNIYKEKYPDDLKNYMLTDDVAKKVVDNLKIDHPEKDLILKRSA